MDAERLLRVLDDEGRSLAASADGADLSRPVWSCPGWTVGDLVAHLTAVYRWAALIVTESRTERPAPEERAALDVPERDAPTLLDAFTTAHLSLLTALRSAPDDLACWTMWPAADPRYYWIRRQAHETLVHRVDAGNALAGAEADCPGVDPEVAADGVDEMVMGFANRYRDRLRSAKPVTLALHATDADRRWWIRLGPGEPEFGRGGIDAPNATEVSARGGQLLLLLWNRRSWENLAVTGSDEPLRTWRHSAHV
jgi:uncharacterized protein (TIGR03083 family)